MSEYFSKRDAYYVTGLEAGRRFGLSREIEGFYFKHERTKKRIQMLLKHFILCLDV